MSADLTMTMALAWLVCLLAAAPVAVLALECAIGARASRRPDDAANPPPFVVVMPAHDEAAVIARAVGDVLAQLRAGDRLVVIADNCADDTAGIARRLGATVIERTDPTRRGKGHALEHARAWLAGAAEQVVVVVDADCSPLPGALARLAATSARRGAAVQGAYLLIPGAQASALVRVSCFAFVVKNLVRQRALQRLAGAALLQGSGMAFPGALFAQLRWRADSLVEDLETGLDLLLAGEAVVFDESARFVSPASSRGGTGSQRRRWEHGMLQATPTAVARLIAAGVGGRGRLLAVAIDLAIPPTVLLMVAAAGVFAVALAALGPIAPVVVLLAAQLALLAALLAAWRAEGRAILPLAALRELPRYVAWKLPILAQFVTARERRWVRTERGS